MEQSSEEIYARCQAARWMLRLIESDITFSDSFFSCVGWIMNGINILASRMGHDLKAPSGRTRIATNARNSIKELETVHPRRLDDCLESLYEDNEILRPQVKELVRAYLEEVIAASPNFSNPLQRRLGKLFGLDKNAMDMCFLAFAIGQYEPMETYFEDSLEITRYTNRHLLGRMLGLSASDAMDIQCSLLGMGVVEEHHRSSLRLTERVERALLASSGRNLQALFCRPLVKTSLSVEEFHIDEESKQHTLALMAGRTSRPVHILLYGAPGAGKTSFAGAIAQALGVKAWAVQCLEQDDVQDRRASLTACLKVSAQNPGSFVLVDEAERLLDTDGGDMRESSAKAWINELLERKNTRIVWITNRVQHLDPAVRRRFSYSIYFRNPGKAESLAMWNSVAARVGVEDRLPLKNREKFAQLYPVPIATMEMALRQAKAHAGKKGFSDWVERVLSAQVTLQNNGVPPKARVDNGGIYDHNAVCATTPVGKFLERAGMLAKRLEAEPEEGQGTMLFYGPPGTGKSALGRHLAHTLNKELIVCRASDLLSPFVGETEMKIAGIFADAEAKKAVLLIDEADSFLFGREGAVRSWERTMVNEFLTQLEACRCLCICTTNFRKSLDPAVMRRFALKMEFTYAGPEQLARLYRAILEPLAASPIDEACLNTLCSQKHLAPGDFKAVRQKMWLEEKPDHTMLLQALLAEQRLKLENETKSVGF